MNSSKMNGLLALALGALLVSACGILKKKQPEPAASATQVAAPTPPPVAPPVAPPVPPAVEPEVTVSDAAIATTEDFEDEAFEKVSEKTYKAELESLRKEIAAK